MGVYKCEICDNVFTAKRNLTRYVKNSRGTKESNECELCRKVFHRVEQLRWHKVSTNFRSTEALYLKYNKMFAKTFNLKRYKCTLLREKTVTLPDPNETVPGNETP